MTEAAVLAIDIGGTKIATGICRADGGLVARQRMTTPVSAGPRAILQTAIDLGRSTLEQASAHGLTAIGIGVGSAGHIDHERGIVTYAADTLPGWAGTDLAGAVGEALGLPVVADNDVNAMALGELRFGAGRSLSHALFLTVGTGVGGALVHNGQLWRGSTWTAGEIGHLLVDWDGARRCSCGRTGHLEAYAAGPAMAERYRERLGTADALDLRTIAERATADDPIAAEVIAEGAHILGLGLNGLLSVLDVDGVIVGGGVAEIGALWWAPLEQTIRGGPMPGPARVQLRKAELGVDAVLVGAGWLALEKVARS